MKNTPTQKELNEQSRIKSIMGPIDRGLADLHEECTDPEEKKCIEGMEGYLREFKRLKKIF